MIRIQKAADFVKEHKAEVAMGGAALTLVAISAALLVIGAQHLHIGNAWMNNNGYVPPTTHIPYEMGMMLAGGAVGGLGLCIAIHLVADKILKRKEEEDATKAMRIRKILMLVKVVTLVASAVIIYLGISHLLHLLDYWKVQWHGRFCDLALLKASMAAMSVGAFLGILALSSLTKDIWTHKATFIKKQEDSDL